MFVYRREALPPDPVFPADLEKLGYFINDKDQIKMISDPEQNFLYKINANERYNEAQKEAMNTCIRETVLSRLHGLGLETLRLPLGASEDSAHVPILVSPGIKNKSRIIVVFGEPVQDLGIWAYRVIGSEAINAGSAVDFASALLGERSEVNGTSEHAAVEATRPCLILANLGQLAWHCGKKQAISLATWDALPRRYAVDLPMKMTHRNKIPGNETWQEHVNYIFEEVLAKRTSKDAKIDIIGLAEGGLGVVRYLAEHWDNWKSRISAICLSNPLHDVVDLEDSHDFAKFISTRARAYLLSPEPINKILPGRDDFGCNCYSSSEEKNVECIMPKAWKSMTKWLDVMHANENLEEVEVMVEEVQASEVVGDWNENSSKE